MTLIKSENKERCEKLSKEIIKTIIVIKAKRQGGT